MTAIPLPFRCSGLQIAAGCAGLLLGFWAGYALLPWGPHPGPGTVHGAWRIEATRTAAGAAPHIVTEVT